MANIAKWQVPVLTTVMSTELNAAGNNSDFRSTLPFSNNTNQFLFCDIEVVLNTLTPTGSSQLPPFLLVLLDEAVDGTNYPNPGSANTTYRLMHTHQLAKIYGGLSAATAQRLVYRQAIIPPGSFFVVLEQQMGVNLNASGNTVKFLTYSMNLNG